jgi:hypothetical protein
MKKIIGAALMLPLLSTQLSSETLTPPGPLAAELRTMGQGGVLSASGYSLQADQVRHLETGGVSLSGVTLTRPGRDGYVLIRQVDVSDLNLMARLLDPTTPCSRTDALSGSVTAREVRFRPDQDLGVPEGREEIRVPVITVSATQIGCSLQVASDADGVTVSGVDGSRIDLARVETRARLSGPEMRSVDLRMDLFGMSLSGPEGDGGISFGEAGFSIVADLSSDGLLEAITTEASLEELIAASREGVLRGGVYLRGLELTPDRFLPERDLQRISLQGAPTIRGGVEVTGSVERGEVRLRASSDLSGLGAWEFTLVGGVPGSGTLTIPDAISASVPIPSELIGATLSRLTFSWRDEGVSELMRGAFGRDPEGVAQSLIGDRLGRVSTRLPGGLPATVNGAWSEISRILRDGSGSAGLRPDQPVSLLELGIAGLMGPSFAASRSGAFTGP